MLASVIWRNLSQKIDHHLQLITVIDQRLDKYSNRTIETFELIKLKQKEHDIKIMELKQHNSKIEKQLLQMQQDLTAMPERVVKIWRSAVN